MSAPTRIQTYEGTYRSQAEDRFRADATQAALHGWHPIDQRWDGTSLRVTYGHGERADPWAAPRKPRVTPGRVAYWVVVLAAVGLALALVISVLLNLSIHGRLFV